MMKEVEELSAGRIVFSTGTLYGALKRLLEAGWIERQESSEDADSGRPRKEYRLTDLGRRILSAEALRLQTLAQAARLRLKDSEA
jgi:DNA-binding PadR family transcriptional regulator